MSHILIVSHNGAGLANIVDVLNTAGYDAAGASTFQEATSFLARQSTDVVIADSRLGAYNGLHVIVRARAEHPGVCGFVTTPVRNRGVEADARRLNIPCLIKPQTPAGWLRAISRALREEGLDVSSSGHDRVVTSSNVECATNVR